MDVKVNVNFLCQRCSLPIHLDQSFSHLNEHTLAEISLPIFAGCDIDFENANLDKVVPRLQLYESSGQNHGFTLVGDSTEHEKVPPLKVVTRLFDLVSSNSDIDHPLCEECTDQLLDMMDGNLDRTQCQVDKYRKLVDSLSGYSESDTRALEAELKQLEEDERDLLNNLDSIDEQLIEAEEVLARNKEEKKHLDEEEGKYWAEYCSFRGHQSAMDQENRSLKSRITYMKHESHRLSQTNVFNATFHVWYSGCFGTINNLRLGRLPTTPVSWPEINAAWGQTILLLSSMAKRANFVFSKHRLVPYGNMSYIENLEDGAILPLYGAGGLRFLWDNKFDAGMIAFLFCAAEFQKFIESYGEQHKKFCLPYPVHKYFLEDTVSKTYYSIKMQFNCEEHWTKALKFLLTNLKWALTWVSSSFPITLDEMKENTGD